MMTSNRCYDGISCFNLKQTQEFDADWNVEEMKDDDWQARVCRSDEVFHDRKKIALHHKLPSGLLSGRFRPSFKVAIRGWLVSIFNEKKRRFTQVQSEKLQFTSYPANYIFQLY